MSTEYVCGSLFVRTMEFARAGAVVDGHEHNFPHTTYVVRGAVLIEKLDAEGKVIKSVTKTASDGFNWTLIEAGVCHRLTALTDDALCHCLYSHRNPQGEVVLAYDGWTPAYV